MSADAVEAAHAEARRLEAGNQLWIVVFGISSQEFVCFPRFSVPFRVILAAKNPDTLPPRMRAIENSSLKTPPHPIPRETETFL